MTSTLRRPPDSQTFKADVQALVDKLDAILPVVNGMIGLNYARTNVQYSGPNLATELAAVKAHLSDSPALAGEREPQGTDDAV